MKATISNFTTTIDGQEIATIAVFLNKEVIASATISMEDSIAIMANLMVKEFYRRKGIGSTILERAKQIAMSEGKVALSLTAEKSNDAALRLYTREGFDVSWENETTYWMSYQLRKGV